ncbi:MAG: hypothetical protein ACRCS8_02170 [Brevinema sp.]
MRALLLMIILLTGACSEKKTSAKTSEVADKPELITPEERASIIAGLENGDYTVLDRFFTTNELKPFLKVQDKIFIKDGKTNIVSFQNKDSIIAYTNVYGIVFLNSTQVILDSVQINCFPFLEYGLLTFFSNLQILDLTNTEEFEDQFLEGISIAIKYPVPCHTPETVIELLSNSKIKSFGYHVLSGTPSYRYGNDYNNAPIIATLLYPFSTKYPELGISFLKQLENPDNIELRKLFFKYILPKQSIKIVLQNYFIYASFYNPSNDNFIRPFKYWDTPSYTY